MSAARTRCDVVVSGGGTAGHVLPAITVARALVDAGHPASAVHFVGSARGMESRLVPEAGFTVTLLPGRGIERSVSARSARAIAEMCVATVMAVAVLARLRPLVVVAVAGYASVPGAVAAYLLRIPVVVVNIDSVPGAANRLVGRFAAASAVAWPGTDLPRAIVTGPPVRAEVLAADRSATGRAAARASLGIGADRFVVLVTGGSLGARSLNDATLALAAEIAARGDLAIYHVCGARDHDRVARERLARALDPAGGLEYTVVAYEDAMATALAACDVVVARAGASTLAEICSVGVASVLVPLPGAPSDHQRRNAEILVDAGAAIVVDDSSLDGHGLASIVESLADDGARLARMGERARSLAPDDGAARIAAVIDGVAGHTRRVRGDRGGHAGESGEISRRGAR
ncbi:MAG TPA: UDP-N-acetylglucosamine--N-acetylmuramyl-(pentapeptide) pyrophosphoryl-undecaprenol N-acetylglucosamine transferase [Acidimicrobiales bacterium]|nr:UDP-N-acetylglucosamine--N-acetylmuramyl-(pentapeptide) pyrophosphoryl-undecaprenol N-acetylglucosamine transferase [Acidimicrobiales bacterium]